MLALGEIDLAHIKVLSPQALAFLAVLVLLFKEQKPPLFKACW